MATSLDQILGYGRDVAQGASNAVASNVSAPVDGIAWLLKKAGLDVGEPVGGSDWMARKGLTAQPKNALAGLLGESFGMAGPMVAAAKAPQIAAGLNKMAANAAARPTLNPQTGAIVWHGSPHQFDAFDSSKIGTGEGAQAYGHGLYLAESPEVAGSYSGKLSSELTYNGRAMQRESGRNSRDSAAWALYLADGDKAAAKASGLAKPELIDALDPAKLKPGGQLYKVDLPDEKIARMLDWDKPLSEQAPLGNGLLREIAEDAGLPVEYARKALIGDRTGRDLYDALGNSKGAAEYLKSWNIPGIRYLDGGSRNAGTGSSNFVVFPGEENVLRILERNGKQLP